MFGQDWVDVVQMSREPSALPFGQYWADVVQTSHVHWGQIRNNNAILAFTGTVVIQKDTFNPAVKKFSNKKLYFSKFSLKTT